MIARLLTFISPQGLAGIAVSIALAALLVIQKGETHHWKTQSSQFEQQLTQAQSALTGTVANYRAAADQARADDQANVQRVTAQQQTINERTSNDYQARLAAARSLAQRLRGETAAAPADSGTGGAAPVPGLPAAAGSADQAAGQDELPPADALTATEQAIQLDELIQWVKAQAKVDPNAASDKAKE